MVALEDWKNRTVTFASLGNVLYDLRFMSTQLLLTQELLRSEAVKAILQTLSPKTDLKPFLDANLTHFNQLMKSNEVSTY